MPSVLLDGQTPTNTNKPKTRDKTSTLRRPPYTYLHLNIINTLSTSMVNRSQTVPTPTPLDEITLRAHLTAALNQYLGLTGTAITIDILKVDPNTNESWIKLPRDDESAVVAALAQWVSGRGNVSIRVNARGTWLGGLTGCRSQPAGQDDKLWILEK